MITNHSTHIPGGCSSSSSSPNGKYDVRGNFKYLPVLLQNKFGRFNEILLTCCSMICGLASLHSVQKTCSTGGLVQGRYNLMIECIDSFKYCINSINESKAFLLFSLLRVLSNCVMHNFRVKLLGS